jgi:hypothetical protein
MRRLSLFIIAIHLLSCQLEDTNINPNDPVDVPIQVLLPPAEQALANFMAGDAAVVAGIFSNYFIGYDGLVRPLEVYEVDNNFFMRPIWNDMYVTVLPTLKIIIEKAEEAQSPHYTGVARVLYALSWGTVSSLWGDVPYREALQGPEILTPVYDGQEDIYLAVQTLLDQAIADLEAPESILSPGEEDLFFGGDLDAWKEVAYSLKARFLMHAIKRDPNVAALALSALENGIAAPAGDLAYPATNQEFNPWYRYQQATPNLRIDQDFRDLLTGDPRRSYLIKFSFGEALIGNGLAGQFAPLRLSTYAESQFLKAEALLRTSGTGAQEALNEAVATHIRQVSEGAVTDSVITEYLQENCVLTGDKEQDLQIVLTQKHIALFPAIEGWTDFRRTGYPALTPNPDGANPNNPNGEIPRRFPYPLNEILYNPNTPDPAPDLQERMWWDF